MQIKNFNETILKSDFKDEIMSEAKTREESFLSVKLEIDAAMMVAHEKLEWVRQTIKANIQGKDNPLGLLVQPEHDYLRCLEL